MEQPLLELLSEVFSRRAPSVIGIDGPAGSGKTTLSAEISTFAEGAGKSVQTIHMDDLYRGWSKPLNSDLYTRMRSIIEDHRNGAELTFSKYDWLRSEFSPAVTYESTDVLILEGVGSCSSSIRPLHDLSIWIEVNDELGLQRVLTREPYLDMDLMRQWQIMERKHFAEDETKNASDFSLSTDPS